MTENHQEIKAQDGVQRRKDFKEAKDNAHISLSAEVNAAHVIDAYAKSYWSKQDKVALTLALDESIETVQAGDLSMCEGMLMGQALSLQSIFVNLSRLSNRQENLRTIEILLRLALKAQNQCRTTLETLANIKNPPIVYAKQANIAGGHQQINNGVVTPSAEVPAPTHAPEKAFSPNELLSEPNHATLDDGRTTPTSEVDTSLETVAAINRR